MVTFHERSPRLRTATKRVGLGRERGASEYYPHPIMISIITLTTLMDIKIVCDMVI